MHEKGLLKRLEIIFHYTKKSEINSLKSCVYLCWGLGGFALHLKPLFFSYNKCKNIKSQKNYLEKYLIWVIFSNHRSNCTPKWPSKDNYSSRVNVSPLRKMIQCSLTEEKLTVNKQHHNIKSRLQSSLNREIYLSIFSNSMLRRKSVTCSITVYVIEHWHLKTISTYTRLFFSFFLVDPMKLLIR